MKQAGLGYTPENRKEVGLEKVHDNLRMAGLARIAPPCVMTLAREIQAVDRQIGNLAFKVSEPMLPVSSLWGATRKTSRLATG